MRQLLLLAMTFCGCSCVATAADCNALKALRLEGVTFVSSERIATGIVTPDYGEPVEKLPTFCRVIGLMAPSNDSSIRFEVWLPESGWNNRFQGVGNGGFAGNMEYRAMGANLRRGYATAGTDTGHQASGTDATWAYRHPEKVVDFGYRAVHETAMKAKLVIKAYYDQAPQHSYFDSCSDGGREALMEAQRFPEDYDGILAGAPANYWSHLLVGGVDAVGSMLDDPTGYISRLKLPAITKAVLAACSTENGLQDKFVSDPTRCHFNPDVLLCKGAESLSCLTAPQVRTLKKLYDGPKTKAGLQVFPGYVPGGEDGANAWGTWITGDGPGSSVGFAFLENYLRYMVYADPTLNILTTKIDDAMQRSDARLPRVLNSTDPDLSRFKARGGKLILYHGWYDPAISPYNTINYYGQVQNKMGGAQTAQFVRLYMVPGMQHCYGGPGPSAFGQGSLPTAKGSKYGVYDALERWVEQNHAPAEIIATKYAGDNPSAKVEMTRPVCAYPAVAQYKGSGDPNDASSFFCPTPR